jgi:ABC-2 type transport system ATP-binding protein
MGAAISVQGLAKRYRRTTALESVDLDIEEGEIFGLVGPNGAGKTTFLQLLAALLNPSAGQAIVLGHDAFADAELLRPRIGYLSQDFSLYGALGVEENLDFFADLYGVPARLREERKKTLLEWSRLAQFSERRASQLSGGMQKKLHLCCSLIHEPDLLLLDEPTTGVDPLSRRELWEILYELVGRGLTLIVSTPYMDEAELCHRVALLSSGQVLRCDTPEALRHTVDEDVWETRANIPSDALSRFVDAGVVSHTHRIGDRVHLLAPKGMDLPATLRNANVFDENRADIELRLVSPSMEDVFVSMVARAKAEDFRSRATMGALGTGASTHGTEKVVRLQGLTRRFGDFVAVDNLSLSVSRGEVFGFLGPNGSGKTTTIRLLCGLLSPSGGRGEVLGQDTRYGGPGIKARIGYMSQRFSLYDDLTVAQNVEFFARGYGLSRERAAERALWALDMTRLRGEESRLARELSGGVKQHLALGCAVLHEPEILFLDEPTAGVDPSSRREFWDLIGELSDAGVTVFVTTHYMDEAEHCHRLGLIYEGRLIAAGKPEELKHDSPAGVMLELECADPYGSLVLLRREPRVVSASIFGRHVHVLIQDVGNAEAGIITRLGSAGIAVDSIEAIPFTLEDAFISLIAKAERQRTTSDV